MSQLDKPSFAHWLAVLAEQCKQPLSTASVKAYYSYFNGRLSTEQFVSSAQRLFAQGGDRLPSPIEWTKLARAMTPDLALPEAPEPLAYKDLDESDKEAVRREIARVRASLTNIANQRPGLTSIGDLVGQGQARQAQMAQMKVWLHGGDSLLRKEALSWAIAQPDVELLQNEFGEVAGIRWTVEVESEVAF